MKKVLSIIAMAVFALAFANCDNAFARTYNITPKAPKVTAGLKPIITKYKNGDYVGSMQDLEELIQVEKDNTYAKYYLALCYTRLGYREEAENIFKEVLIRDENLALSYYSQRALDCIGNPSNPVCNPNQQDTSKDDEEIDLEKEKERTEMDMFIQSGRKIHPAAMDRITKERMDRRLQEEEYIRTQKEQEAMMNGNLQS